MPNKEKTHNYIQVILTYISAYSSLSLSLKTVSKLNTSTMKTLQPLPKQSQPSIH